MSSFGTVELREIWAMLADCAPGFTRVEREHNWLITWGEKSFPALPKGPHGKRRNPGIEIGHVRQLVRQFEIEDCAHKHFRQIKPKSQPSGQQ